MNEENKKGGLHVHLGGLIIIIIIILILFKVDLKEKIQSPQFQKNITYIENFFKNIWNNNIKGKVNDAKKDLTKNLVNSGIEEVQKSMNIKLDEIKK